MADDLDEELKQIQRSKVNAVGPGIGLAAGVLPFMVSFRQTHEESFRATAGGAEITSVTRKTAFDYVAVPCGALAFVLGMVGLLRGLSARKLEVAGIGVAAMALGVLQILRGFLP
jgi:hypothetical protein